MGRREKILSAAALVLALAAFHGYGFCVFLYPGLLSQALRPLPPRQRVAYAAAWGVLFAAAFYHWVGAYGLLPWLALSLVRGLPWAIFVLPDLMLTWKRPDDDRHSLGSRVRHVVAGGLGLALVSAVLLTGITGVDWETPAGALTFWPAMLAPLRWVGLSAVALAIGLVSHLLVALDVRQVLLGSMLLAGWVAVTPSLVLPGAGGPPIAVALLQTGFSQRDKWDEEHRTISVDWLLGETEKAAKAGARLVIWPETAWPYRGLRRRVTNTRRIGRAARRLKIDILATSIEEVPEMKDPDWFNSASLVLASGKFSQVYEKRRLAPFAEYIPLPRAVEAVLRRVRPFSRISRFVPGPTATIFDTSGGQHFAVLICYESMTPTLARRLASQVDFLVVVTNDAPFNHSQANEAHFRSAILRAIETGKPILQAANTGVTGAVAGDGTVLLRSAPGFSGPDVQYIRP